MEKFLIKGPTPKGVFGSINCSGAKNAALPLMASSILFEGTVILKNIPLVHSAKLMARVILIGMLVLLVLLQILQEYFLEKKCQVGMVIKL